MAREDLLRIRFNLMLFVGAAVPALVFSLIWKFSNQHIKYLGGSLDGEGSCFCVGLLCWGEIVRRYFANTVTFAASTTSEIIKSIATHFAVAPFSIIAGRILFTFLPPWSGEFGAVAGLILGVRLTRAARAVPSSRFVPVRGTILLSEEEAERRKLLLEKTDEPEIVWAGKKYPAEIAFGNMVVVGGVGTGKTLMHRATMASVLPHITPGSDRRAILYDVKSDLVAELRTMNVTCEVVILNPFDKRSVAWDIRNDVSTPARARQFAHALIPSGIDEDGKFFANAARSVVTGLINALNRREVLWSLRDLINLAADKELMEKLLGKSSRLVKQFFSPEKTFSNVINEMATVLSVLEPVAALWEQMSEMRSLREWVERGDSILILGGNEDSRETLQVINRVMLKIMAATIFTRDESPQKTTLWFFCDELADAGKLDCLPALLNARSKGVRCVLGFQDFEGLFIGYDSHDKAKAIIGKCDTISWLKLTTDETAEWACKRSGRIERLEYMESHSKDGTTVGEQLTERDAILASQFMGLPDVKKGLVDGFHMIRGLGGIVRREIQFKYKKLNARENLIHWPKSISQELEEWSDADAVRLAIADAFDLQITAASSVAIKVPTADLDRIQRIEFE